ncbi:MAG: hypothetical protein ABI968_02260 [Acidobacteriota bacterium]
MPQGAAMPKAAEKRRIGVWLGMFILVPLGAWLTASVRSGFRGKSVSNLCIEPIVVCAMSLVVFFVWFLLARKGLRPFVGIALLLLLSAAALFFQQHVPGLHE